MLPSAQRHIGGLQTLQHWIIFKPKFAVHQWSHKDNTNKCMWDRVQYWATGHQWLCCNRHNLWMLSEAWTQSKQSVIQTWRTKTRIKQHSCLTRATTVLPEYNLPNSREKIATVAPQPLYKTAYQPNLCPHLIVKSSSKVDIGHLQKRLAAETIDTYPNTMTHVDTNGSVRNAVEQEGYGLTTQHPDATRKDISAALGQNFNNYDAELKAIRSALQTISNDCDNPHPPCVNNIVVTDTDKWVTHQRRSWWSS